MSLVTAGAANDGPAGTAWRQSGAGSTLPDAAFKHPAGKVFRTNPPLQVGGGIARR